MPKNFKQIKNILMVVAIFTLSLPACERTKYVNKYIEKPNAPTPAPTQNSPSPEGGVTAGGGGTLPANPGTVYDVLRIIEDSKKYLRTYLKHQLYMYQLNGEGLFGYESKLYGGSKTILDLVDEVDLELRFNEPCYDSKNNPTDGSIYSKKANTICISAFAIAPKLDEFLLHQEVLALIVHELSHLLGTDEKEAVEIQKGALRAFKEKKFDTWELETQGQIAGQYLNMLSELIKSAKDNQDYSLIDQKINDFYKDTYSNKFLEIGEYFSYQDAAEYEYAYLTFARLRVVSLFVQMMSLTPANPNYKTIKDELDNIFKDKDEVTYQEYYDNRFRVDQSLLANEKIKKINDRDQLCEALIQIYKYYEHMENVVSAIAWDHPLPKLKIPLEETSQNAWSPFIGKYKAVTKNCQSNGYLNDVTELEVIKMVDSLGREIFQIKYIYPNGYGHYSLELDNSSPISITYGGTSFIDYKSGEFAKKTTKRFGNWYDRMGYLPHQRESIEIRAAEFGIKFKAEVYSETNKFRYGEKDNGQIIEKISQASCELDLVKVQ